MPVVRSHTVAYTALNAVNVGETFLVPTGSSLLPGVLTTGTALAGAVAVSYTEGGGAPMPWRATLVPTGGTAPADASAPVAPVPGGYLYLDVTGGA